MLRACNPCIRPQITPCTQERRRSSLSDDPTWAVHAFAEAALGALRRTKRRRALATVLAQNPRASLPAARGPSALRTATSRFCAHEALAPQDSIHRHMEATYGRHATVPVGFAVPDTPEAPWTRLRATTSVGPRGPRAGQGLFVPRALAIPPERGPLGLGAHQGGAREATEGGPRARRQQRPRTQQESQQGLWSLEALDHAPAGWPQTRWVSVGDRAAAL